MADERDERGDRIDRHARHERGLGGIVGGDDQRREADRLRRVGNRQHAINMAHAAVQREFPDDERAAIASFGMSICIEASRMPRAMGRS